MSNYIDSIKISGVTYDIQGSGGGGITVDPTLDSGSTNPVANSAITTALDAKVNIVGNIVPAKTIMYTYDAGDTTTKWVYNNGLRINQFFVSYPNSWNRQYANAWTSVYITNGSTRSQIYLRVNASNYQITSVVSTAGDFTYALEGGSVNVTLPDGYYIDTLTQNSNFQISYGKYTIYGGQSASALQSTDNVIQNIYNEVPKRFITGGSITSDSNYLYSYLYDNNGNVNSPAIPLGTSIKGDGNRLDVYFNGQTIHEKILNTGNGNYCSVPNSPAWNYTDDLGEVNIFFNNGYTGSNTSYTIQVQTIAPNTNTYTDNLYYDVANHTLDVSSAIYVTATTYGDDYTYSIKPKQEYSSYRILAIRENNWCNIAGIDNQRKEEFIITGVTTPSYSYQAQEIIDDLYSKVGGGKVIEAGRGIAVTTGETADTVSFNLPISAGTGSDSIIEGYSTVASGGYSHAEGMETTASGYSSHAEGISTTASGEFSHAEGAGANASGSRSHAEGDGTTASGNYGSHAEGSNTTASGYTSHAEGYGTTANGDYSHVEGQNTITNNQSEHASGQYNVSNNASATFGDSGNTLFSVGNGTSTSARHNAFEIRQNGDIYLSSGGTDIKLQDHLGGGGGNPTVELTQAEYDALVTAGTVSADTYYIITDAQAVDLTQYWTSAQTQSAINQATSGKVDASSVVSSVTSASTDSEIPTAKAVYDATQSGGGKAVSGGTNISITTGETADTINCTIPIRFNNYYSVSVGHTGNTLAEYGSFTWGGTPFNSTSNNTAGYFSQGGGYGCRANGQYSLAIGRENSATTDFSVALNAWNSTSNQYESSFGRYNKSVNGSATFGDSGNTLFSVGNGTNSANKHNAFEIRQNGDIYITINGQDVKLQDILLQLSGTTS